MKTEDHSERTLELAGWPVRVISYKLGDKYLATADNVSPGANIAKAQGATKEEAESAVLAKAEERLARTRTMPVDY
ncbi:MAG: hypothetical protein O2968_04780 [Acidobacteria bacterium]|nr:hypothetical protein [Acidobacteriota bacterium]